MLGAAPSVAFGGTRFRHGLYRILPISGQGYCLEGDAKGTPNCVKAVQGVENYST